MNQASSNYSITTICGSMRYYREMLEAAERLTKEKYIVLMPFVLKDPNGTDKEMLDDMHKRKIDMSGSIVVVGLHIGESTGSEIEYAKHRGKKVLYWSNRFGAMP